MSAEISLSLPLKKKEKKKKKEKRKKKGLSLKTTGIPNFSVKTLYSTLFHLLI